MTEIKVNRKKNLCYIKLSGFMEAEEIIDAKERAIKALSTLNTDIIIINDISEFKPVRAELMKHIAETQAFAFQKGVSKVIRVVKSPLSSMQFKKTQTDSGAAYETIEVRTLDEAMAMI